jgi:hypothetical protein
MAKRYVRPGEAFSHRVAWSEVACHLQVAGKRMRMVLLVGTQPWQDCVQLLKDSGAQYSAPILPGEAGLYRDAHGYYVSTS